MSIINVKKHTTVEVDTPQLNRSSIYIKTDNSLAWKDDTGTEHVAATGISPEEVQDIIGSTLADSSTVDFVYNDVGNQITANVIQSAIDHGSIAGLGDDDHTQYLNNTRGDARYYTKTQLDAGQLDNRYYTETEANSLLSNKISTSEKGTANGIAGLDAAQKILLINIPSGIDHTTLNNIGTNTHAQIDTYIAGTTTRDNANRDRANHTGTQLASTISDFAAAVRSTVLTGLSLATNAAIVATDSILTALGKIQAQINGHFGQGGAVHALATSSVAGFMSAPDKVKLDGIVSDVILPVSTALLSTSNVTFTTINELAIPVVAGKRYKFEAYLLFDSNATNTGIGLSVGGTATGTLRAIAEAPVSNTAGTGNKFSGPINALNGVVTTTGVGTVGTQYRGIIEGVFTANTSGLIYPQFRSETNGTQVRVNIDSNMVYKEY